MHYLEAVAFDDTADNDRIKVPFVEYLDDLLFASLSGNDQHPLLRF